MALPSEFVLGVDNVAVSVYSFKSGFGINGATPNALVGTVYGIGSNVYNVSNAQKVGFLKTDAFFATDAGETFIIVNKDDILTVYEDPV